MTQNKFHASTEKTTNKYYYEYGFIFADGEMSDGQGCWMATSKTEVLKAILSALEDGEQLAWFSILTEEEYAESIKDIMNGVMPESNWVDGPEWLREI